MGHKHEMIDSEKIFVQGRAKLNLPERSGTRGIESVGCVLTA